MKTRHLIIMALAAVMTLTSCISGPKSAGLSYAPWVDLNAHFDLESVTKLDGSNMFTFNSFTMTQNRLPITSERLENSEYAARILGTGVAMRMKPIVSRSNKIATLSTGQHLTVTQHNLYANGRYWCYGYFQYWGEDVYDKGYVCSDYIVSAEQYEMVQKYLFQQGSNLNIKTQSKFLRAAADVLLKLEADKRMPNLSVMMLNQYPVGMHTIVAYQIRDYGMTANNCMLAFVQFNNANNEYVIIGVVPGNGVNNVMPNPNGSYDIYFY